MDALCERNLWLENQLVTGRRGARRRKAGPLARLFPALCLFVALMIQISVRVASIEFGYQLETLREEALENDARLRQLRLSYAVLTRPRELSARAQNELAMVPLMPQRVRRVVN